MRWWMRVGVLFVLATGLCTAACNGGETEEDATSDVTFDTGGTDTAPQDTGPGVCGPFCARLEECDIPYPNCQAQCEQGVVRVDMITCVSDGDTCSDVRACYNITDAGDVADDSEPADTSDAGPRDATDVDTGGGDTSDTTLPPDTTDTGADLGDAPSDTTADSADSADGS